MAPYTRVERREEDLFKDHSAGIDFSKYESIEVSVRPNTVPPAQSFAEMGLHPLLMENVNRCAYKTPTPVQKQGVPIVVQGNDLMACAQTGSGKTAAFLLPAINFVLHNAMRPMPGRCAYPTALVMAPTRELSIQIYEEGRKFTYRTGLRCVVAYGGADARSQVMELQRGCNVIVATPGRLLDLFRRGVLSFSQIRFLVLDEADRMLDMGFVPQIRQIVEGPETDMPPTGQRQTLMYSATFPREIQMLAGSFLHNHFFLQIGRIGSTTENITQHVTWVEDSEKHARLMTHVREFENQLVLIFVEKRRDADYLERALHQWGVPAVAIHGDRGQREREMALAMFKSGQRSVLVATDVAARGLDIPNVAGIIQYDLPTNIDDYVHRIGRTGRAGKKGIAIAMFNEKNRGIGGELRQVLFEANQTVPDFLAQHAMPQRGGRGGFRGGRGGGFRGSRGGGYGGGNSFYTGGGGGARGGFHARGGFDGHRGGFDGAAPRGGRGRGAFQGPPSEPRGFFTRSG
jgi:ATP-dependent RNA helicase DDX3X